MQFLGYILSYFLSGILLVQLCTSWRLTTAKQALIILTASVLYYLSFRRTDPRQIIITGKYRKSMVLLTTITNTLPYAVFAVFFVEFLSTVFATMIVIMALIVDGFISYSIFLWGFKIVALLSGLGKFYLVLSSRLYRRRNQPTFLADLKLLSWFMHFIAGVSASWAVTGE